MIGIIANFSFRPRRLPSLCCGCSLVLLLLTWPLSAATVLRAGITDDVQPPFARVSGQLNHGIVPDIYRLLLTASG